MKDRIKTSPRIAALSLALPLLACSASQESEPRPDPENPAEVNPFAPGDLEDAASALFEALGDDVDPSGVKIAVVANRHSNYWTPAQIGTGRAASAIGCFATFDATSDGESSSQVEILNRKVEQGFVGISVSAIDAVDVESAVAPAMDSDVNVITFDSDAAGGSKRLLYLGTVNYEAGFAAGEKMVELLGDEGGQVAAFAGLSTAANAQERIQGIEDAFQGTEVELVQSYFDEIDFDVARQNVEDALDEYADLAGVIGVYAYNGPIALGVLEEQDKVGAMKLVAFDLDVGTLDGLAAGKVDAAIGQRPYWMGFLSVYILYAMHALGPEETMSLLEPWISGSNGDVFSTGQDIVTPDTIELYRAYLAELGISSS
jgi:ribose transport system substrate-binding protein